MLLADEMVKALLSFNDEAQVADQSAESCSSPVEKAAFDDTIAL